MDFLNEIFEYIDVRYIISREKERERERERERNFSSFPWSKISQEFFAFTTLLQLILEPFQFTSSGNNEE